MDEKPSPSELGSQREEYPSGRLPPELREYFLRQLTEEEERRMLADLQEIQETGGLEFSDFIGELEELVNNLERPQ